MHYSENKSQNECYEVMKQQQSLRKYLRFFPKITKAITFSLLKKYSKDAIDEAHDIVAHKLAYQNKPEEEKKRIIQDMLLWYATYGFPPSDYAQFRFDLKSEDERKTYYADIELAAYVNLCRSPETYRLCQSKALLYERLAPFFKRGVFYLKSQEDFPKCQAFLEKYPEILAKPLNDYGGFGIQHLIVPKGKEAETAQKLLEKGPRLLEERLRPSAVMAQLNSSSINTLRVVTFRNDHEIQIIHAAQNVGRAGSLNDNYCSGGIYIPIDLQTKKTRSESIIGYDDFNHAIHPDTGKDLSGFEIPEWDGMFRLITEASAFLPEDMHVFGWDLAHTDNGWEIIEVNDIPGDFQSEKNGYAESMRQLFKPCLEKCGKTLLF